METEPQNESEAKYIDNVVLKLIWKKTGLLFIKPKQGMHYIIPDNLREFVSLVDLLQSMDNCENNLELMGKNIDTFQEYFINSWCTKNLSYTYNNILKEFLEIDLEYKNQYIVKKLCNLIEFSDYEEMPYAQSVERIKIHRLDAIKFITKITNSLNVDIGEIISTLKTFKQYSFDKDAPKFIFSIKTLYSIYLTKFIKVSSMYTDARILLGGSLYNFNYNFLLPRRCDFSFNLNYNDIKLYNGSKTIKDAVTNIIENKSLITNNNLDMLNISHQNIKKHIQIMEWLNYFTFYSDKIDFEILKIRNKGFENFKANLNEPYYSIPLNIEDPDIYISTGMLTFVLNLLNPKENFKNHFALSLYESDLIENVPVFSLTKTICEWQKTYKTVLPIYSIEFIEHLTDDLNLAFKKEHKKDRENFEIFINAINNVIESIFEKNKYIYSNKDIQSFKNAYIKCPLINFMFKDEELDNNVLLSKEDITYLWSQFKFDNFSHSSQSEIYSEFRLKKVPLKNGLIPFTENDIKILSDLKNFFKKPSRKTIPSNLKRINNISNILDKYKDYNKCNEFIKAFLKINDELTQISNLPSGHKLRSQGLTKASNDILNQLNMLTEEFKKVNNDMEVKKLYYNDIAVSIDPSKETSEETTVVDTVNS